MEKNTKKEVANNEIATERLQVETEMKAGGLASSGLHALVSGRCRAERRVSQCVHNPY